MQWSDITSPASSRTLRQFAGLWLLVFGALAGWRVWHGDTGAVTLAVVIAALIVGIAGLIRPSAIRWIFTASMIVTFPIGWTVSKLVLAVLFYLLFTPIALVFRLMGRDALQLRRRRSGSYWAPYPGSRRPEDYFRTY